MMPTVEAIAKKPVSLADASPERIVALLIGVFLVFHLIMAAALGLGVDECYTIGVSHDLKLFYYDHPPLHYWIAHAFMPLLGDGRALRLPFVAMFAATSWLMYLLARQLFGARAGIWAVLALNLSAFFTLAGGWVVPDGPLMLCLTAAAYTIARGLFPFARRCRRGGPGSLPDYGSASPVFRNTMSCCSSSACWSMSSARRSGEACCCTRRHGPAPPSRWRS